MTGLKAEGAEAKSEDIPEKENPAKKSAEKPLKPDPMAKQCDDFDGISKSNTGTAVHHLTCSAFSPRVSCPSVLGHNRFAFKSISVDYHIAHYCRMHLEQCLPLVDTYSCWACTSFGSMLSTPCNACSGDPNPGLRSYAVKQEAAVEGNC